MEVIKTAIHDSYPSAHRLLTDGTPLLPQAVVSASSVNEFKNKLDTHWADMVMISLPDPEHS